MPNFRSKGEAAKFFAGPSPRVIAHRGASALRPENTLPAFEQAVIDGADILETDVHLTADGEIIAIHDCTVDRTTEGSGNVHEMPYKQLRNLDAGYHFSPDGGNTYPFRGRGVYIPRLEELLRNFPHKPLNIGLKDECVDLVEKLVELLNKYGRIREGSALLVANRGKMMRKLRRIAPEALTSHSRPEAYRFSAGAFLGLSFLTADCKADAVQVADRSGWLSPSIPSLVRSAHDLGLEVHVWTVNNQERMNALLAMGVDGLFTDNPALLRQVVASGSWRSCADRE